MISSFINIEQFISIILIHLFAVISPGPDFAIVVNQSTKFGRKSALLTSLGISFGILGHVFYCIVGVGYIISQNIHLFNIIKIIGALYLCYLGISSFRATNNKLEYKNNFKFNNYINNPFFIGLITNLLNPKATLFFISLFALVIDSETSYYIQIFYGIWMAIVTCLWFCLVSLLISSYYLKIFINKYSILIDRIMGTILILISIKIIFT